MVCSYFQEDICTHYYFQKSGALIFQVQCSKLALEELVFAVVVIHIIATKNSLVEFSVQGIVTIISNNALSRLC